MAYRLNFNSLLPDAFRDCVREELADAISRLRDDFEADPVMAIHEARKNLKKTRALLRLVRSGIPGGVYRQENGTLRDAARLVSGARDADVLVATVEALAGRYVGRIPADDFAQLRDQLRAESLASQAGASAEADRAEAVALLEAVAERIDGWPLARCDWMTAAAGIDRAYRAGREAFACADTGPTIERLHDWRKRVKDIWYHQRLLCPAWPEVLGAQAEEAHRLSEILGDDHDLAVLAVRLRAEDGTRPAVPLDPDPLLGLIDWRRAELLADGRQLGWLVYAERPAAFARRTGRYIERARIGEAGGGGGI